MSHDDFETEPIPGLPANLPAGEHIVWQGRPDRKAFARIVLHERLIMAYFVVLIAWKFGTGLYDGETVSQALFTSATLATGALIVLGLIRWYARAVEKTTIYTLTNRRVVMRFGVALPITFNFPFAQVTEVNLKNVVDDKGTLSIGLAEHTKISWLILWPHVRPWMIARPQPSIRLVPNVDLVADLLRQKLQEFHKHSETPINVVRTKPVSTKIKAAAPADLKEQEA